MTELVAAAANETIREELKRLDGSIREFESELALHNPDSREYQGAAGPLLAFRAMREALMSIHFTTEAWEADRPLTDEELRDIDAFGNET